MEAAVSDAVTALIGIQFCFDRLPAGVPYGIFIFDVKIFPVAVPGNIVIAVTGQAEKFCILIEGISAAGVGNQSEEIPASQIINPGKGRFGRCNYIFLMRIVKTTELHN